MTKLLALVFLLQASHLEAFPTYWGQRVGNGCEVPTRGYKFHRNPVMDSGTTLQLLDSSGNSVALYEPGASYTMKISFAQRSRSFVLASAGELSSLEAIENVGMKLW